MSIGTESPSGSQYLSNSYSTITQSKKASSEISKTYKHASQLYLTRRLAEAYELLHPVITPPAKSEEYTTNDDEPSPLAPIAFGTTSHRIKIWSLYITLLNAVVELDPEEGRREFGSKEFGNIVRNVQSGDIWEQVVQNGYRGREDSVDAEVVYNLSNLLLAQAPNQIVNQSRLETYLSSSSNINLDISAHLSNSLSNGRRSQLNGTSTPKDLTSRIKIIELFTLHVLPRNDDWEYAKSFVNNSDVLDDERREAFLQTLAELQEAKEAEETAYTDAEEDFGQHDDYTNDPVEEYKEDFKHTDEQSVNGVASKSHEKASKHRRTGSEVDYGIDQTHPNGSNIDTRTQTLAEASKAPVSPPLSLPTQTTSAPDVSIPKSSAPAHRATPTTTASDNKSIPSSNPQRRPPASKSSRSKPPTSSSNQKNTFLRHASQVLVLLRTLSNNISSSISKSPAALMRTLMFIVGVLAVLSRRDVRERMRRVLEQGWGKIRGTIGMGVKVSYI